MKWSISRTDGTSCIRFETNMRQKVSRGLSWMKMFCRYYRVVSCWAAVSSRVVNLWGSVPMGDHWSWSRIRLVSKSLHEDFLDFRLFFRQSRASLVESFRVFLPLWIPQLEHRKKPKENSRVRLSKGMFTWWPFTHAESKRRTSLVKDVKLAPVERLDYLTHLESGTRVCRMGSFVSSESICWCDMSIRTTWLQFFIVFVSMWWIFVFEVLSWGRDFRSMHPV